MPTRVSTNQLFTGGLEHISRARSRELESSEKSMTNKEINRPSDDPGHWVRIQDLKDGLSTSDNIQKNAQTAMHFMTAAETALNQVQEYVQHAHEVAVAASSTGSPTAPLVKEIQGVWDNILQTMNSRYADRSVFAGFNTKSAAFDKEGNYLGDDGRVNIQIAANTEAIPINFSGTQIFLGHGLDNGTDFVKTFHDLIEGLKEGNLDKIHDSLPKLLQANEQISLGRAEIAGRMNQIKRALEGYSSERISTSDSISKLEDADAYKVFSELARDQTVFQSALAVNKKVLSDASADILFK